jgi:hypothetical protein
VRSKTKWVLGFSIGIPLVLVCSLVLMLRLSSLRPEMDLASIEVKELPGAWEQESTSTEVVGDSVGDMSGLEFPVSGMPATEVSEEDTSLPPSITTFELPIAGTLVMMNGDEPFGEESFDVNLEGEQIMLRSNGKFWFKTLLATITLTYDQVLRLDSQLRPMSLASTFDGPLGFGRETQAEFTEGQAIIRSGNDVKEFPVDLERAFVLGTFSTYAVIPLLYELREFEDEVALETLFFGGPSSSEDEAEADGIPETTISRIEDIVIQFGGRQMTVTQYELSGNMGTMMLFAHDIELLGLLAGDGEEESMFVYRADYFEDGFEIMGSGR